jgi:hypothetical protein
LAGLGARSRNRERFGNLLLLFGPDGGAVGDGVNARSEPPMSMRGDLRLLLALAWFLLLSSGAATLPEPVAMR